MTNIPIFSPDIFVLYEHSSIPLAIYYVEGGSFKAYLVSEGACRMYESTRDEMFARLNGPDPFINIVERDEMYKAVADFSEKDEPYNVVFHEYVGKNRKLITVHCVGVHEYTRDGRRYSIVRYDEISDSSRKTLFKDEERAMDERDRLRNEIDDAIARSYTSVIYFDTKDQMAHEVRLNRFGRLLVDEIEKNPTMRNLMDVYVRALVYKDDAQGVLKFGDFDYVMERLKETNPVYHTYRTIRDGRIVFYRLKIIPFDNGRKLIYGFEHFDDQIREKLARESEREMQMTLLSGLSCEFESIWIVDAAIHHTKLIRNNTELEEHLELMVHEREGSYETVIGNYIDRYIVPEDRERVYLESSIENLMRKTKENEVFHINYARTDPGGNRNHIQLCVARVTDDMGVVRFVCGFRNIDSIIEEQKNRTMLYSMAHMDHMTNVNNRRSFDEYMDSRSGEPVPEGFVFFSFDLNNLKEANDTHGHEAGDELIIGAAQCMKEVLGPYGSIYRTGGDEFSALVTIDPAKFDELADKLKERFNSWHGRLYPKISISTGYVRAEEDPDMTIEDMRREAEKRMYAQKSDYYMQEKNDRRRARKKPH